MYGKHLRTEYIKDPQSWTFKNTDKYPFKPFDRKKNFVKKFNKKIDAGQRVARLLGNENKKRERLV